MCNSNNRFACRKPKINYAESVQKSIIFLFCFNYELCLFRKFGNVYSYWCTVSLLERFETLVRAGRKTRQLRKCWLRQSLPASVPLPRAHDFAVRREENSRQNTILQRPWEKLTEKRSMLMAKIYFAVSFCLGRRQKTLFLLQNVFIAFSYNSDEEQPYITNVNLGNIYNYY
jgi:hypothetical protein